MLIVIILIVSLRNQGLNICGGRIYVKLSDRLWSPPTFLYNSYGGVFSGGKASKSSIWKIIAIQCPD